MSTTPDDAGIPDGVPADESPRRPDEGVAAGRASELTEARKRVQSTFLSALDRAFRNSKFASAGPRRGWKRVGDRYKELTGRKSPRSVEHWRQGENFPQLEGFAVLSAIFECSIETFFDSSEGPLLIDGGNLKGLVRAAGPGADLYLVPAEARFHSVPQETAGRFRDILSELNSEGSFRRLTVLMPLPHWTYDADAGSRRSGDHLQALLTLFSAIAGRPGNVRYLYYDPALFPVDAVAGARLMISPGTDDAHHYQEIACHVPGDESGSRSMWFRVEHGTGERAWTALRAAILPVPDPELGADRMEFSGRDEFHEMFGDETIVESYAYLQERLELVREDRMELLVRIRELLGPFSGNLKILEVGCGNFLTSWDLIYREMHDMDSRLRFHVTGVDPVRHRRTDDVACLQTRLVLKKLEHFDISLNRFDLVVATRALTTTDPHNLAKLLAYVRPGGYLFVIQAALEDSMSFEIAQRADAFVRPGQEGNLAKSKASIAGRFEGDYRRISPFRIFGEELADWFRARRIPCGELPLRSLLPTAPLLSADGSELTEDGKKVLRPFLGRQKPLDSFMASAQGESLLEYFRSSQYLQNRDLFLWVRREGPDMDWLSHRESGERVLEPRPQSRVPPRSPSREERTPLRAGTAQNSALADAFAPYDAEAAPDVADRADG